MSIEDGETPWVSKSTKVLLLFSRSLCNTTGYLFFNIVFIFSVTISSLID